VKFHYQKNNELTLICISKKTIFVLICLVFLQSHFKHKNHSIIWKTIALKVNALFRMAGQLKKQPAVEQETTIGGQIN
jgi:hypothetical protein